MIGEGIRIGANAFRAILQRRKEKKAQKKAEKAAEKASAIEKKLLEKISPGDSGGTQMALPVFASVGLSGEEKTGVTGILKKFWPVAAGLAGLLLVISFFRKKRR
jgi:hypothetical protein